MFFIPFFKKVDWRKPPLVTLGLILLNCLIYIVFQANDSEHTEQAYTYYLDSDLPAIELPLYIGYLKKHNRWEQADAYQAYMENNEQGYTLAVVVPMHQDDAFMTLLDNGKLFDSTGQRQTWQAQRQEFDKRLHKATWYAYGLQPNEPTALTFITNIFLHGGWGHLIGNMVFLFIIGFVVEAALGKTSYFTGYMIAGLCGGALYVLFNSDSQTATVGASGAIAGLMGMYTVLFGLRKINFFYFIFVYFDYVKAPAIVLLPIWLGHELLQLLLAADQGVNYFAHIGGLCSGALYAFVAKTYVRNINLDYLDQNEKHEAQQNRYEQAMELLAEMRTREAAHLFRSLVAENPGNREYLVRWYNAAKLNPASDDFHAAARRIMMLSDKDQKTYQLIRNTCNDYMKLAQPKPKITVQLLCGVIAPLALGGFFDDAEKLLRLIKHAKPRDAVAEAALVLANAFYKANNNQKYQHYLQLITREFAQTATAAEAGKRLQWLNSKAG